MTAAKASKGLEKTVTLQSVAWSNFEYSYCYWLRCQFIEGYHLIFCQEMLEVIYQTREAAFYHISKHLEESWKYDA